MAISVFVGVLGADQLAKRRGLTPIPIREFFVSSRSRSPVLELISL